MKKITSRLFGIGLALCMVFALIPINAFAAGADNIVQIARGEVGVSGRPNKYTYFTGRVGNTYSYSWCASFVSWCANQAGESGAIPKTVNVRDMARGIQNAGGRRVSSPQAGDIVVYRRISDNYYAHVGIMENSSTAIEGNSGNAVRRGIYPGNYSFSGSSVANGKIEVIYLRPNYRGSGGGTSLSVQSYFDCDVQITATKYQRVDLYNNPTDSNPRTYFLQGQTSYSTRGAKLSDGSTWYEIQASVGGTVTTLWLNSASSGVTVRDLKPSTPAPAERKPVNLGSDFYAYIVNTGLGRYVTNDSDGNVVSRSRYSVASPNIWMQIWHFTRLSNGAYKIASPYNNYCLDVQEFGKTSGTNARAYLDNGCSAQQWYLYEENGAYHLRGSCTDCYLDVADNSDEEGHNIHLWEPNGTGAQRFSIEKVDTGSISAYIPANRKPVNLGSDFYAYIVNTGLGRYVTNDTNGNVSSRSQYSVSSPDIQRQIWHFTRLSNGAYKIASPYNNYCLDVQEFGRSSGTNARAYLDNGCSAQQWYLYEENGAYNLRGSCTDCYLDVSDNSDTEGQNIHLWEPNGTGAQRFSIKKTDIARTALHANVGSSVEEQVVSAAAQEVMPQQSGVQSLISGLPESKSEISASVGGILKSLLPGE